MKLRRKGKCRKKNMILEQVVKEFKIKEEEKKKTEEDMKLLQENYQELISLREKKNGGSST